MPGQFHPLPLYQISVIRSAQVHETADSHRVPGLRGCLDRVPARKHDAVFIKIILLPINGSILKVLGIRPFSPAVGLEIKPPGILTRAGIFLGYRTFLGQLILIKPQAHPSPGHGAVLTQVIDVVALIIPARTHPCITVKTVSAVPYILPAVFLGLAVLAKVIPAFFLKAVLAVGMDPAIPDHGAAAIHVIGVGNPGALLYLPFASQIIGLSVPGLPVIDNIIALAVLISPASVFFYPAARGLLHACCNRSVPRPLFLWHIFLNPFGNGVICRALIRVFLSHGCPGCRCRHPQPCRHCPYHSFCGHTIHLLIDFILPETGTK